MVTVVSLGVIAWRCFSVIINCIADLVTSLCFHYTKTNHSFKSSIIITHCESKQCALWQWEHTVCSISESSCMQLKNQPLVVSLRVFIILAAYSFLVSLWTALFTTLNAPLQYKNRHSVKFVQTVCVCVCMWGTNTTVNILYLWC